jgi:hypothetical protein
MWSWLALGKGAQEIRTILRNVAALSEAAITAIVPTASGLIPGCRSLAVIGEDLPTSRGELFPMPLEAAAQHGEIALIRDRTAVPSNVAGARALLLFGSTVLGHCCTGKQKHQSADNHWMGFHGTFLRSIQRCYSPRRARYCM